MNISIAILAFLSEGSKSGYELKKLFAESESLHWSGNNNQVYKALLQLHRDGLADVEVQQPREGPARKVYTITETGLAALREWALAEPEMPEFRSAIVARLIAGGALSPDELDRVLSAYEEQLRMKILMVEEKERRAGRASAGSEREIYLRLLINEYPAVLLRAEREWVLRAQWALARLRAESR